MKLLTLLMLLCYVSLAQDFHGVSIGGTLETPTITNHADQAVYGYVWVTTSDTVMPEFGKDGRLTGKEVPFVHTHMVFSSDRIVYAGGIKPGETVVPGALVLGTKVSVFHPVTKKEYPEGRPVGFAITGVLFADGTFYGTDQDLEALRSAVYMSRSYARDVQYLANREDSLNADARAARPERATVGPRFHNRKALATIFLMVKDFNGREAMDRSVARIAAIPDLRKGE